MEVWLPFTLIAHVYRFNIPRSKGRLEPENVLRATSGSRETPTRSQLNVLIVVFATAFLSMGTGPEALRANKGNIARYDRRNGGNLDIPQPASTRRRTISVKECGAKGDGVTDDAPAINACIADGESLKLPCGIYGLHQPIIARNKTRFRLFGKGDCSIIKPLQGWPTSANVIDVSGSTVFEVAHLRFDGTNLANFVSITMSAIIGDGTEANRIYGYGTVHHITLKNWSQQGIGIGANAPNIVTGFRIQHNVLNIQGAAVAGNAIDTGGSGTKTNIVITNNRISYLSQPTAPTNGCVGIFTGHGSNSDVTVANNQISNACDVGIVAASRPLSGEATTFTGGTIRHNLIQNSRSAGIAIYGSVGTKIVGNRIYNPGQGAARIAVHNCIYVSHGVSGKQNVSARNLQIIGNTCIDDQPHPTMDFGIDFVNDAGFAAQANVLKNFIRGAQILDYHLVNASNAVVICCSLKTK